MYSISSICTAHSIPTVHNCIGGTLGTNCLDTGALLRVIDTYDSLPVMIE